MEENGKRISQLQEIREPTGEEMVPVALNGANGYVKLSDISPTLILEHDEKTMTLKVTGIKIIVKETQQ